MTPRTSFQDNMIELSKLSTKLNTGYYQILVILILLAIASDILVIVIY